MIALALLIAATAGLLWLDLLPWFWLCSSAGQQNDIAPLA